MTEDELLEQLAQRWESHIEELGEASGSHDMVAPIEASAWLLAIMEVRYVKEHGELPDVPEDLDAEQYTMFASSDEPSADQLREELSTLSSQ